MLGCSGTVCGVFLEIAVIVLSLWCMLLVLLHKGTGGGINDMFSSTGSGFRDSAKAPRNLALMLWISASLWLAVVVLIAVGV